MAYLTLFLPKISCKFTEKSQSLGRGGSSRLGQIPNFYQKFVLKASLSLARWLVKIIGRVNAKIFVWAIDQNLKASFQPYENHLLNQMAKVLGIQRRLQIQVQERHNNTWWCKLRVIHTKRVVRIKSTFNILCIFLF